MVPLQESWNLDWSYAEWQSPRDIYTSLGSYTDRCVGLTGLFPGLRWRGSFLAISAFVQPSSNMMKVADILENHAIGQGTPYLAGANNNLCLQTITYALIEISRVT
jgi:hypothetical protein